MKTKEMIFCNELQPNTHIRITDSHGIEKDYIVRRMIIIQSEKGGEMSPLDDVEILLDKSKNIYFSYGMYLAGKSWVLGIEVLS